MNTEPQSLSRREVLKTCAALAVGAGLSPVVSGAAESPAAGGHLHHILRIHLPLDAAERRTTEVIDYCRRTGCQEILLFTTSYDHAPSFQPLEEIGKYMQAIQPQVDRLKRAGVIVSVNVLQTVGHVYFPMALQKQFPFQRRVCADGHVSTEGACPLCPNLRAWVAGTYRIYAQLHPPVLFVDDDYRTMMAGGMSCFCPLHLKAIGGLAGREVKREEVVSAVLSDAWPAPELRRHYYTATTAGFAGLAGEIRRAVDSVSPETRVGLMTAAWPSGAQGVDVPQVLQALAGPHRPMVRPQIPGYSEAFIRDAAPAFLNPIRMRAALPDNVEYWPEIENYQYSQYAKSARCTLAQMTVCVLNGFNHLALNVFDMFGSPLGDSKRLIDQLEAGRGFLDRIHELVPEGQRAAGVNIFEHPKQLQVRRAAGSPGRLMNSGGAARQLPALGLPVTAGVSSPWQMLTGDDVLALDDAALDALLARGALMDADAAQALALRGQAGRIGVTVGDTIPLDELGYEQFSDALISPSLQGRCFPLRPLVHGSQWRRLTPSTTSRAASEIRNYRRDVVAPALLLTENAKGERFAVMASSGGGDRHLMENLMRPEQLRNTFGWIARRPLPVCGHHDAPYLWPILNRTADGRLVVGLVNLATDVYDTLSLVLDRQQVPRRFTVVGASGQVTPGRFRVSPGLDDRTVRLDIRHRLEPFEVAVFVMG